MTTIRFWRQSKALVTSERRRDREPLLTRQPAEQNVCSAQRKGRSGSKAPTSLPGRGSTHLLGQSCEAAGAPGGGAHLKMGLKSNVARQAKARGKVLTRLTWKLPLVTKKPGASPVHPAMPLRASSVWASLDVILGCRVPLPQPPRLIHQLEKQKKGPSTGPCAILRGSAMFSWVTRRVSAGRGCCLPGSEGWVGHAGSWHPGSSQMPNCVCQHSVNRPVRRDKLHFCLNLHPMHPPRPHEDSRGCPPGQVLVEPAFSVSTYFWPVFLFSFSLLSL